MSTVASFEHNDHCMSIVRAHVDSPGIQSTVPCIEELFLANTIAISNITSSMATPR